jgi:hypothetical protein
VGKKINFKLATNVLWLGEGCLTDAQFSHKFKWQLLPNRCYLLGGLSVGTKKKIKMKATGLKLICERADGEITTWHDVFETTVEDVINKMKHSKRWIGGKFLEAYLEFDNDGRYYKVYLDVKERGFNQLLGS